MALFGGDMLRAVAPLQNCSAVQLRAVTRVWRPHTLVHFNVEVGSKLVDRGIVGGRMGDEL